MKKTVIALIPFLLIACSSTPRTDSSPAPQSNKTSDASAKASPAPVTSAAQDNNADLESRRLAAEKLAAEIRELQKQSVYFDFDKFAVKPEYAGIVEQEATFLKAHKNDSITVEGNADERGSEEYNLALGDRRATAVQKNLELLGIPAGQIRIVSFGEEKPRLSCHEEKCWKENRRVDFAHSLTGDKSASSPGGGTLAKD